jgi:hypothetical protein
MAWTIRTPRAAIGVTSGRKKADSAVRQTAFAYDCHSLNHQYHPHKQYSSVPIPFANGDKRNRMTNYRVKIEAQVERETISILRRTMSVARIFWATMDLYLTLRNCKCGASRPTFSKI